MIRKILLVVFLSFFLSFSIVLAKERCSNSKEQIEDAIKIFLANYKKEFTELTEDEREIWRSFWEKNLFSNSLFWECSKVCKEMMKEKGIKEYSYHPFWNRPDGDIKKAKESGKFLILFLNYGFYPVNVDFIGSVILKEIFDNVEVGFFLSGREDKGKIFAKYEKEYTSSSFPFCIVYNPSLMNLSDLDYAKRKEKSKNIGYDVFVFKYSEMGDTFFAKRINCSGFHLEKVLESEEGFFWTPKREIYEMQKKEVSKILARSTWNMYREMIMWIEKEFGKSGRGLMKMKD